MNAEHVLVLLAGVVVLIGTARSVVAVLIVPRPASSMVLSPMQVVRALFRRLSQLARDFPLKDRILSVSEPLALLVLLATWLTMTMIGFTLVNWGIGARTMATAFNEAGSSEFTLGFTLSHNHGATVVDFVAAATGMVLVALQIAYLPALYASYNRRETLVTLLESRAGAPAWGPELLIRHQLVGTIDNLPSLFAEWERWAADVAESHTTYPSLLYLRSPRVQNSWIVSLIAVMDAAALALAVDPDNTPSEARMCIRMGFTCLRDIAQVMHIPFDPDPDPGDPIELPRSAFDEAHEHLRSVGYQVSRPQGEAWAHFKGWRVNYESVAYAMTYRLDAPPATWTGPRRRYRGESMEPQRPEDKQPVPLRHDPGRKVEPDGPEA